MATSIRPLTYAERKKPAQLSFYGGFKNVSFQIGTLELPKGAERNINGSSAGFTKAILRKSPKIQFPLMIPHSMGILKGEQNTVASVVGNKHMDGTYDAVLVARTSERLSSFNSKLRTVRDLVENSGEAEDEANDRLEEEECQIIEYFVDDMPQTKSVLKKHLPKGKIDWSAL